jgi:hypothetical protein
MNMNANPSKLHPPLWRHDCQQCVPLGTFTFHDLYFCRGILGGSVIARYGHDGPDYASGPVDVLLKAGWREREPNNPLVVAIGRAQERGLR